MIPSFRVGLYFVNAKDHRGSSSAAAGSPHNETPVTLPAASI